MIYTGKCFRTPRIIYNQGWSPHQHMFLVETDYFGFLWTQVDQYNQESQDKYTEWYAIDWISGLVLSSPHCSHSLSMTVTWLHRVKHLLDFISFWVNYSKSLKHSEHVFRKGCLKCTMAGIIHINKVDYLIEQLFYKIMLDEKFNIKGLCKNLSLSYTKITRFVFLG